MEYFIRKLEPSDTTNNFSLGDKSFLPLKAFLQKQAKQFQNSSIAQTYVAVANDDAIIGYITLTCSEINLQNCYQVDDCDHANKYDFLPSVKIARLAVDKRHRKQGVGENLVFYAIALIKDRIAENVGCRFVVTDAKADSVSFYEKKGFVLLDSEANSLAEHKIMFIDLVNLGD